MLDLPCTSITAPSLEATELEDLLRYLKQAQQIDLTGYKRSTLLRRIQLRMKQVGAKHYQEYRDRLTQQSNEVSHLLSTIFINFTSFFRDRPVWDGLKHEVIPQIIANKKPDEPIRVWSAGCASGEEAYSLAILLAEALGVEQFQQRVRIYATDVDLDAVLKARRGCYSPHAVATVPPDLLERYFENTAIGYCCRRKFSGSILFCHHNLMQASPLPHIDLLLCRNTLMYFTPETQNRVLARFHYSLQPQGFLLLGQAESLVSHRALSLFTLINVKARLYTKVQAIDRHSLPMQRNSPLTIAFCQPPTQNEGFSNRLDENNPSSPVSPLEQDNEQSQLEIMQHEIAWLQEQVKSLEDRLSDRSQQQHEPSSMAS